MRLTLAVNFVPKWHEVSKNKEAWEAYPSVQGRALSRLSHQEDTQMQKLTRLGTRVVLILIACGTTPTALRADFIKIDDSKEGNPVVTADNPGSLTIITSSPEFVHFTFTEFTTATVTVTRFRDLLESDGTVSDRFIETQTLGSNLVDVVFSSDPNVVQPPAGAVQLQPLVEDGSFQTVFQFTGTEAGSSFYQVKSALDVVPEPSSLLMGLTGVGFLSFGWLRRVGPLLRGAFHSRE